MMIPALLARIGLTTLKKQIIAGLIASLIVIVPVTVRMTINSWKSDIENAATGRVINAVKDSKIETLEEGKQIDEKILNSDDDDICAALGGCLRATPKTPTPD